MTVQNDIHRSHVLLPSTAAGKSKRYLMAPQRRFSRVVVQGCGRKVFACSGYGSGRSWTNRGSNGNYRSSSWYSARNARNLNFNSSGVNPQNNNNSRNTGMAARPVQHTLLTIILFSVLIMTLTRQQLLLDLYQAFYSARRHKSRRSYIRVWERNLRENMEQLCDDLYNRTYKALPSKCFIVEYPKKREIFAAQFRDRIVHHLYYNYTHQLFEQTFIADSYSCIKGRGTHYGIRRITNFCRKASCNWQYPCYALHLDIRGYFMHISRSRLLLFTTDTLRRMASHPAPASVCCKAISSPSVPYAAILSQPSPKPHTWADRLDIPFLLYLTEQIVMLDPAEDCQLCSPLSEWEGLNSSKSLLKQQPGLGLPIGNLTSQLFSNIYLNLFDQYMKRQLHCRYYGRYVDDVIVVSPDRQWLLSLIPQARQFLSDNLGLQLHEGKLTISEVHRGVEFLGVYIKPYRTYISSHAVRRMEKKIKDIGCSRQPMIARSVNSYLGIFHHASTYHLRRRLLMSRRIMRAVTFNADITKATYNKKHYSPLNIQQT